MADPLRHTQKLDIAAEILEYLYMASESEAVMALKNILQLSNDDLFDASESVSNIRDLMDKQRY